MKGLFPVMLLLPVLVTAQDDPLIDDPSQPHATLDFRRSPMAEALMMVTPIQIDGRQLGSQATDRVTWWVRPGAHTLSFAALSAPTGLSGSLRARRGSRGSTSAVTLEVEAGLRYHMAGAGIPDGTWTPVVWKIVDEETGEELYNLLEEVRARQAREEDNR